MSNNLIPFPNKSPPPATDSPQSDLPSDKNQSWEKGQSSNDGPTFVGVPARSFNFCEGVLGAPGTGKSTYALARSIQIARDTPAYLFAHDQGWKLPDRFHDGRETGIIRHRDIREASVRMATDPSGVHSISTVDAKEVIQYAAAVADASLRSNQGRGGVPSIVLIDEVVSAADANPYRLGEDLRKAMALRRHHNIGIIWTSQSPNLCHYQMLAMGTRLVVFRLRHRRDLEQLEKVGIEDDVIDIVTTLPDHHFIIHECR